MELILLGVDTIIVSTLYYYYKKKLKLLLNIKNAVEFDANNMNSNEYAMVVGKVKADGVDLKSHYNRDITGVIRILEIKEHGTTWRNNISSDTTRTISRVVKDVPFSLLDNNVRFQVHKPLDADYVLDNLDTSYTQFDAVQESILSRIISSFFSNEQVRGVETTEHMLMEGTEITVFGKVNKFADVYRLSAPDGDKGYTYVITSLNKAALVDKLAHTSRTFKIFLLIFGSLGALVGVYWAYKFTRDYLSQRKRQNQIAQARQQRLRNQRQRAQYYDNEIPPPHPPSNTNNTTSTTTSNNNSNDTASSPCVICLTNPRELVLLECGHVCLCMDCFERMPAPTCPICRQRYTSFLPCYIP